MAAARDVVRHVYDALNRDDMPALLERIAADAEWVNPHDAVESGVRSGHEGFRIAIGNMRAIFEKFEYSISSVSELGDEIVVEAALQAQGRGGTELTAMRHHVWTVRDGRVTRFRWFNTRDEALAAAREG